MQHHSAALYICFAVQLSCQRPMHDGALIKDEFFNASNEAILMHEHNGSFGCEGSPRNG